MLPFPKRKSPEELELGDDDLVVLEDVADEVDVELDFGGAAASDVDLAQTVQRKRPSMLLPSTRPIDERVEDDVAGQCLASIAAEVRSPQSASGIRAVLAAAPPPPVLPPPPSVPVAMQVPGQARAEISASYTIPPHARLPRVTAPPFVRKTTPPSAFARRSSPSLPAMRPAMSTAPMMPLARPATASEMPPPAVHSIAPAQVPAEARAVEPTVIVVRERPKAGWILASAAIGAICALAAVKVIVSPAREEAAPVREVATTTIATAVVAGPAAAPPAASVVVPITPNPALAHPAPTTAVVAPAAPAATGAVVRFGDEQGVAIAAPKPTTASSVSDRPAASAKPASAPKAAAPTKPAPAKPAKAPSNALPDGSFPLGQTESKSASTSAAAPASSPSQAEKAAQSALASTILSSANTPPGTAPATRSAPASAPEPALAPAPAPRRRALTPEQQIADAQLKASMK